MAAILPLVLAAPAGAFEWTIPASFHMISLAGPENHDLLGLQVPMLWLGGPLGPFALHFAGGYAYQRERVIGDNFNFVTLQADLDLEVPLGPLVPYIGGEIMGWYPIDARGYLQGLPLMASPHAGVRFSLFDLMALDVSVFGAPNVQNLWNVTNGAGQAYTGSTFGAGGRFTLNL